MYDARKDVLTAARVDIALIQQRLVSADRAALSLRAAGVSTRVIERVLANGMVRASMTILAPALPAPLEGPGRPHGSEFYCTTGRRRDVVSAAMVQAALALLDNGGAVRAERLLRREALPEEVIGRVLFSDRRHSRRR